MQQPPVSMATHHTVILGDARMMSELTDQSVHLIVTSPPYWQLKDYGNENQIGFNDSYEEYIDNLNLVWTECFRVLHRGCRLCVNIGDQFSRSVYYGRYKIIPIRTEIIRFCETIGLDYMGAVIWRKVTTTNTTGGATIMGSFPYPRNGILKLDYEFILIFRKQGSAPKPDAEAKEQSRLTTREWNTYFSGHWNFPGEKQKDHLAMFPLEVPRRLIRMFSFTGDTVLDPFLGSGTTSLAALTLGRNSAGYEINGNFMPVIREKLNGGSRKNRKNCTTEFVVGAGGPDDLRERIDRLPYRFIDPHRLERTVDPRTMAYGSRINADGIQRNNHNRVAEVLTGELLLLSDGRKVRLLGVSVDAMTSSGAVAFLTERTVGKKVVLRFDGTETTGGECPSAYVYLPNGMSLNAHLIKEGLAVVDRARDFRLKKRFLSYQQSRRRIRAR